MSHARIRDIFLKSYKASTSKPGDTAAAQGCKPFIIQLPDNEALRLREAVGWLELGNALMGREELDKITPQWRLHPDVLEVRWQVFAQSQKWSACVDIAEALVRLAPERLFGWIQRSYALYKLNRPQEAYLRLLPALDRFANASAIANDLAWYGGHIKGPAIPKLALLPNRN